MNTLLIIFKGKFIQLFRSWKSFLKLGGILLGLGAIVLYSWLFSLILTSNNLDSEAVKYTEMAILWTALVAGILKDFFPSYRNSTGLIGQQYPIPAIKSWLIISLSDFLHFFWVCVLTAVLTLLILIPEESQSLLLKLALLLSAIPALSFSIRQLIDFNRHHRPLWAGILTLLIAVPVALVVTDQPAFILYPIFAVFSVSVWVYSFLLYRQPVREEHKRRTVKPGNNPLRWFTVNHKELRKVTIMSFLFKILFLILFVNTESEAITNTIVFIAFLSPIFVFSYFGNNLWGIARGVWLTMHRLNAPWSRRFRVYLNIMALPLFGDAVISFGLIAVFGDNFLFLTIYYLTSLILLIIFGFWASLQFPKYIDNAISFGKNTTSIAANFMTMGGIGVLISANYSPWFYLLWIFPILATALAFMYLIQNHESMSVKMFEKLTAGE